ncbi:hypothetical protein HHI36_005191, partial [Cryptolaemus montrouzieri]
SAAGTTATYSCQDINSVSLHLTGGSHPNGIMQNVNSASGSNHAISLVQTPTDNWELGEIENRVKVIL